MAGGGGGGMEVIERTSSMRSSMSLELVVTLPLEGKTHFHWRRDTGLHRDPGRGWEGAGTRREGVLGVRQRKRGGWGWEKEEEEEEDREREKERERNQTSNPGK